MMHSEHILKGFADEMGKLAAIDKKKKAAVGSLVKEKDKEKDKEKGKDQLGNQSRKGSFYGQQTDTSHDISVPYDRDGTSAQHGSFEAQSSEANRGQI